MGVMGEVLTNLVQDAWEGGPVTELLAGAAPGVVSGAGGAASGGVRGVANLLSNDAVQEAIVNRGLGAAEQYTATYLERILAGAEELAGADSGAAYDYVESGMWLTDFPKAGAAVIGVGGVAAGIGHIIGAASGGSFGGQKMGGNKRPFEMPGSGGPPSKVPNFNPGTDYMDISQSGGGDGNLPTQKGMYLSPLRESVKTDNQQLVLVVANLVTSLIAAVSSYLAHHKLRVHLGRATLDLSVDAVSCSPCGPPSSDSACDSIPRSST